jgi:hypothetical protein
MRSTRGDVRDLIDLRKHNREPRSGGGPSSPPSLDFRSRSIFDLFNSIGRKWKKPRWPGRSWEQPRQYLTVME